MTDSAPPAPTLRPRPLVRVAGWAVMALAVVGGLELVSWLYLRHQQTRYRWWFKLDIDDVIDAIDAKRLAEAGAPPSPANLVVVHPTRGWTRNPGSRGTTDTGVTISTDELGARRTSNPGTVLMSVYGDSFTEGVEVDDDDTYAAALERATAARALNFGVQGYGPDQALLYLEENLRRGLRTPIVILAIINESTQRLLSAYRPFYTLPDEDTPLAFKPFFERRRDGYALFFERPDDWTSRESVRAAAHRAAAHDVFYAERSTRLAFPYTRSAAAFIARQGVWPEVAWPGAGAEAGARLAHVLRRFHALAVEFDFVPVFALLPQGEAGLETRGGSEHPVIGAVVREVALERLRYVDVEQELTSSAPARVVPDFDRTRYLRLTHPSPYGNEAIARVLAHALRVRIEAARAGRAEGDASRAHSFDRAGRMSPDAGAVP